MKVTVVRGKEDRGIKGVYASTDAAERDIVDLYGDPIVELSSEEMTKRISEILDNFEFLEFEVEN